MTIWVRMSAASVGVGDEAVEVVGCDCGCGGTKRFSMSAAGVDERVGYEVGLGIIVIVPTSAPHTLTPTPPSR